jgi:hypothetical protein
MEARVRGMGESESDIDARTRRLIRAVDGDLRRHLGLGRLGVELVGDLYVRVRDVLARERSVAPGTDGDENQLVDDLALAIFMSVVADEAHEAGGPDLLVGLRRSLSRALRDER